MEPLGQTWLIHDKFHHPASGWLLVDRSIVYDAWISWRQALPANPAKRSLLDIQTSDAIMTLAWGIHEVHMRFSDYHRLGDTPFLFSRWWDPDAEWDWATGQRCLFRIEGSNAAEFLNRWRPEESGVLVEPASENFLEARLRQLPDPLGLPADHVFSAPRKRPPRHRRRNPRSQTPGSSPASAESEKTPPQNQAGE